MLQFLDGLLTPVDSKSVLPGYAEAQDISTFLEGVGFEGNNVFGGGDTGFTVEMWRTEYRPEGEAQPSLFIIELCGRVLSESRPQGSDSLLTPMGYRSFLQMPPAPSGFLE